MKRTLAPFLAIALPFCLAACASNDKYPSLSKREAERITGSAPAAEPIDAGEPPAQPGGNLEEQLITLLDNARTANASFLEIQGEVAATIARSQGADQGSEEWSNAEVALARLEAARSNAMISLGELDQLYADERVAHPGPETPLATRIAEVRNEVSELVISQTEVIQSLAPATGG